MSSAAQATEIGVFTCIFFAAILYGLTSAQSLFYFRSKRAGNDKALIKIMVFMLWFLDTLDLAFSGLSLFQISIADPASVQIIGGAYWAFVVSFIIEAVVEAIVRSFYCFRIWTMSNGNWALTLLTSVLAIVAFVFSMWLPIAAAEFGLVAISKMRITIAVTYIFAISAVVADLTIAGILVHILWTIRKQSGIERTNTVIGNLITYTVSTGLLTSLAALILLITYVTSDSLVYAGVRFVVAKMYINAMLATLNERGALRDGFDTTLSPSIGTVPMFFHSSQTERTQQNSLTKKQGCKPNISSLNSGTLGFENDNHGDLVLRDMPPTKKGSDDNYTGSSNLEVKLAHCDISS